MINLNNLVKTSMRKMGYEISRYSPAISEDARFLAMLKEHNINLIFDVGANSGQFVQKIRLSGYKEQVVSFEPLLSAYKLLVKNSKRDSKWIIAPQGAIGDRNGSVEINIAGNSASSSILDMLETHKKASPGTGYLGKEVVTLRKLDSIGFDYLNDNSRLFLKIDTQGFEQQVLLGAEKLINEKTIGIQLELSLLPLYEGQKLFEEMNTTIKNLGFTLWGIEPVFVDPKSGRLLQIDATYFR